MAMVTEFDGLPDAWAPISSALTENRLDWKGLSLAALGSVATRFEVVCQPFEQSSEGQWQVSRWVGCFTHAGQSWYIEPRIGRQRFLAMIGDVFSIGVSPGGGVSLSDENNLTSLAWLLAHDSAWRRHRGAAKAFVRREVCDAPSLRGQLDLAAQLGKLVDKHHFACRYDDLTYDNSINRGTLLAIKVLKQHGSFPFNGTGNHHRIAREWQAALQANGVETPAHFPAGSVRWSRANDGFRAAHLLAELVVGERQTTASATRDTSAFLFDSAEVWELYLHRQLQAALRELSHEFPDYVVDWPRERRGTPDALLEWQGQRILSQIPDLHILRPDGTVALVIDAKYRHYQPPTKDAEIALQMFRYAASAKRRMDEDWPPTLLLYPSCDRLDGKDGLNPQDGDGPFERGRGRFLVAGEPMLSAWLVKLPKVEDLHDSVRRQLRCILGLELS